MPYGYVSQNVSYTSLHKVNKVKFSLSTVLTAGRISLLASSVLITSPSLGLSVADLIEFVPTLKLNENEAAALIKALQNPSNQQHFSISTLPISTSQSHSNQVLADKEVLVKVEGNKCYIVAKGSDINEYILRINENESDAKTILIHALDSEVYPLQNIGDEDFTVKFAELNEIASQYEEYQKFNKTFYDEINRDTRRLTQGLEGLADIVYILDIVANTIEITTAVGGASVWIIKKLLAKRKNNENNYFINNHISILESVANYFEKIPKSRIAEISIGTGISKEKLLPILNALSFEHEPACFWKPPTIKKELLKPALRIAKAKQKKEAEAINEVVKHKPAILFFQKLIKYKSIIFISKSLFIISTIWVIDFILKSSLDSQIMVICVMLALLIILLILSWQPNKDIINTENSASTRNAIIKKSKETKNKKGKSKKRSHSP